MTSWPSLRRPWIAARRIKPTICWATCVPYLIGQSRAAYRSIIHELYPGEYEWRHLSPEQEGRQRQRGRDLAKLRPWERGRIGKIEKQISWKMTVGRFGAWGVNDPYVLRTGFSKVKSNRDALDG
jgi:hypothetical protein